MNDRHPILVEVLVWVRDELSGEGETGIGSFIIGTGMGKCKIGKLLGVVSSMNSVIRYEVLTQWL